MISSGQLNQIRKHFPIFQKDPKLIYLDSSSTSLKPQSVIDAVSEYYSEYSANIKRGIYTISERATTEYEKTRDTIAEFLHVKRDEVIFTRNTTEALNLVMYSLGTAIVEKNDEVVVTLMEHHSNFVPWQQLCLNIGADFKIIRVTKHGMLDIPSQGLENIVTKKTKILALTHVSNVLGTINPIKEIIKAARSINPSIVIVIDGAQAVPHIPVNIAELDCDFYAFSGHKMLGPTGVGVLWGRKKLLNTMEPFLFGGEMINEVRLDKTIFAEPPDKFEAGTPAIAEVVGLRKAVEFLKAVGMDMISKHEVALAHRYKVEIQKLLKNDVAFYGPVKPQAGILSFSVKGIHPHDLSSILNEDGIAIRAGHHCAMPLHTSLSLAGTARISLYLYNCEDEIDAVLKSLYKAVTMFR